MPDDDIIIRWKHVANFTLTLRSEIYKNVGLSVNNIFLFLVVSTVIK
jgi:hypothetical protein